MTAARVKVQNPTLPQAGGSSHGLEGATGHDHHGAFAFTIPLPVSPCRGFEPELSLGYSSSGGHGPFGLGFSLSLSSIARRTSHGYPRYSESDVYQMDGTPLVPADEEVRTLDGRKYLVTRMRPRLDQAFARIELFKSVEGEDAFWRVISHANVVYTYGRTPAARIADPDDPRRIFAWLIEEIADPKGDRILHCYKPDGADRYPERVLYGNAGSSWHFETVFDYGEYDPGPENSKPYHPVREWGERLDVARSFDAGFARATRRLCRSVLQFHRFPELGPAPVLVQVMRFTYRETPAASLLCQVEHAGSRLTEGRYEQLRLPPLLLDYTGFQPEQAAPVEIPVPAEGTQFLDLYGQGIPGVFCGVAQGGPLFWPARLGMPVAYGAAEKIAHWPADAAQVQMMDVSGTGRLDLVRFDPPAGLYANLADGRFAAFKPFEKAPSTGLMPNCEFADLTGGGASDLVEIGPDAVTYYPACGDAGYGMFERTPGTGIAPTIHPEPTTLHGFADTFGTGGQHRIRISRNRVDVWPNLGYGRFGAVMTIKAAPDFGDSFDVARLHLVNIDGSSAAGLAYIHEDRVDIYRNWGGDSFAAAPLQVALPAPCRFPWQVEFTDLYGRGYQCLVFTESLVATETKGRRWCWDFCGGCKPHLLARVDSGTGARSIITYDTSTRFFLRDGADGRPWTVPLPLPVTVVASVEREDTIARINTVSTYRYSHGRYDGIEREFCGFGRIDRADTEALREGATPRAANGPALRAPTVTRTWYSTGDADDLERCVREAFSKDTRAWPMPKSLLDWNGLIPLDAADAELRRQAWFALNGQTLREEIYGEEHEVPYGVTEHAHWVRLEWKTRAGSHAFSVHPREELNYDYERIETDPRITHECTLRLDESGNVLRSAALVYSRRTPDSGATPAGSRLTCDLSGFLAPLHGADEWLTGVHSESRSYELAAPSTTPIDPVDLDRWIDNHLPQGRLLSWERLIYTGRNGGETPAEEIAPQALLRRQLSAAFSHAQAQELFGSLPLPDGLERFLSTRGGYALDQDYWWSPSSTVTFDSAAFYLPKKLTDPFGTAVEYGYDTHALLLVSSRSVAHGVLDTVHQADGLDYHALVPTRLTDPNGLVSEVRLDALGQVIATAHGKPGDSDGFAPLSTWRVPPEATMTEVLARPEAYLQGAATFHLYEPCAQPPRTVSLTAETYAPGCRIQAEVLHEDGSGRVAQTLLRMEDGRWLASGLVVHDNKGHPYRAYEPYFTDLPDFAPKAVGLTAQYHRDALDRVVRVDYPRGPFDECGVYSTASFTPWCHTTWDVNDNLLNSPLYERLIKDTPPDDTDPFEIEALKQSEAHAGTPAVLHLDMLGHTDRLDEECAPGDRRTTRYGHDIAGQELWSADPRLDAAGLRNFERTYALDGQVLKTLSADAGEHLTLEDALGRTLLGRDARGFLFLHAYDGLGRPSGVTVLGGDGPAGMNHLVERIVYADSLDSTGAPPIPEPEAANLRGTVLRHYDSAGLTIVESRDPYGAPRRASTRLRTGGGQPADWFANGTWNEVFTKLDSALESPAFVSGFTYDALHRLTETIDPLGNRHEESYFLSGWVHERRFNGRVYSEIPIYNAKGHPLEVSLANGVRCFYTYEPATDRLKRLTARRGDLAVMDLSYTYDPAGNITRVHDWLNPEAGVHHRFDALYRLVESEGLARAGRPEGADGWGSLAPFLVPAPDERYRQSFTFDEGSNLVRTTYTTDAVAWEREQPVEGRSNRQAAARYDAAGNLLQLEKTVLAWDYADHLQSAVMPHGTEVYLYDGSAERSRKVFKGADGAVEDTIYLGNVEICMSTAPDGGSKTVRRTSIAGGAAERIETADGTVHERFILHDGFGSCRRILDDTGSLVSDEAFLPYGGTARATATDPTEADLKDRRFSGERRDSHSGLYYYGHRYYAPALGRWLSPDPAGPIDGLNLYLFVSGNPVTWRDHAGLVGRKLTLRRAQGSNPRKRRKNLPGGYRQATPSTIQVGPSLILPRTNLLFSRATPPIPGAPTSDAAAAALAFGQRNDAGMMKLKWKGTRIAGQTTGIHVHITRRSKIGWSSSHRRAMRAFGGRLAHAGGRGLKNRYGYHFAENSHLVAGSLFGPNDAVSAPPASVHQNTEWLAIEQGLKRLSTGLGQSANVRFKVTGYVRSGKPFALHGARFKIYIGGTKTFDHFSRGDRGAIDQNEAAGLQARVEALTPGSLSLPTKPMKGVTGTPPTRQAMAAGHANSAASPLFTGVEVGSASYTGTAAVNHITRTFNL